MHHYIYSTGGAWNGPKVKSQFGWHLSCWHSGGVLMLTMAWRQIVQRPRYRGERRLSHIPCLLLHPLVPLSITVFQLAFTLMLSCAHLCQFRRCFPYYPIVDQDETPSLRFDEVFCQSQQHYPCSNTFPKQSWPHDRVTTHARLTKQQENNRLIHPLNNV